MLTEVRTKSQITLPTTIVKQLNLKVGDKLDIELEDNKIVLKPVVIIPRDQAYFWSNEWQKDEKRVNREIEEGKIDSSNNTDELFKDLGL